MHTIENAPHPVVVRGGHSLYCVTCDRDVARLAHGTHDVARGDKTHEREVRGLLRPGLNVRWDLYAPTFEAVGTSVIYRDDTRSSDVYAVQS